MTRILIFVTVAVCLTNYCNRWLDHFVATSQVFGDQAAGFSNSCVYPIFANYYVTNSRNQRLNMQLIDITRRSAAPSGNSSAG